MRQITKQTKNNKAHHSSFILQKSIKSFNKQKGL